MPDVVDQLIGDPADFAPDRTELDFSGVGLKVVEANWGESAVEAAMVRQDLGETAVDRHLPNKESILKLIVRGEGETELPTVAGQLQAKVGIWQQEGGWIQRNFKVGGNFGSLACQVKKATLADFAGWQKGDSPDVTLALVTGPVWYATVEVESDVYTEESARELILELSEVLGTHPGLIRIRITNSGAEDWRGLIFAAESRDHPGAETKDTTAALAYDAADLTLKGGAKVESFTIDVVGHDSLTAGWLTILNSEIAGVGHMTHKGVRRLWIRAYDRGDKPGDVELRLRWRALGALRWTENAIVPSPLVDAMQWLDMGECRPEQAALGDNRWEWELQARAPGGSASVWVHRVSPAPTEQYMVLRAPGETQAAHAQSQKSPGTVESVAGAGTEAWDTPGNAKASDDSRAIAKVQGAGLSPKPTSQYLKATNFGFALPEGATPVGIIAEVERSAELANLFTFRDHRVRIVKGGVIGTTDKSSPDKWPETTPFLGKGGEAYKAYGSAVDPWGESWAATDINNSGFGVAISVTNTDSGAPVEVRIDHIRITVYYTEAADENHVCFAERSIELRSDGVYRQHPEDDVWGRVVPEGFLPYAAPSGLEGRPMRMIIIPTQGDLGEIADSGANELSAQVLTRDAYPFSREAFAGALYPSESLYPSETLYPTK